LKEDINILFELSAHSPQDISINLVSKELVVGSDLSISFNVNDNLLNRIIHNLDDVDITMKDKGSIEAFELNYSQKRPWLFK
jgi:3-isopropylmalate dehydratase small subunit